MGRRDEVVAAALVVLAEKGTRGLTHGAVDRAAGVPAGTTSNHFRTRVALLQGMVRALNDRFVGTVDSGAAPKDDTELLERLAAGVEQAIDPRLPNGVAFIMLNYEAASDSQIADLLTTAILRFEQVIAGWLGTLGSSSPDADAALLAQYLRGLAVNQRTLPDPDFDPKDALEPMVHSLLRRS